MEIQTHKGMRKAEFAENKVRALSEEAAFERAMCSLPTNQEMTNAVKRNMRYNYCENQCLWGMITAKINVCGV